MQMKFLGDSYDIVKQSLLRWLQVFGEWKVHPMFTQNVAPADIAIYEGLLNAQIVSAEVLTMGEDRAAYFERVASCGHLFLDPDTGLRMRPTNGKDAPKFIFGTELQRLVQHRPDSLTMVFDQSVPRGAERTSLEAKLEKLRHQGVFGFAYASHACFVVVGRDCSLVGEARHRVIGASKLPEGRILPRSPL